jgi:parallel beta-helix repeat protein
MLKQVSVLILIGVFCLSSFTFLHVGARASRLVPSSNVESSSLALSTQTFSDDFSSNSGMWEYLGSAYRDTTNQYVVLTEPVGLQAGAIFLNTSFRTCFDANFSYKAGGGSGADGFVMFFYKENYSDLGPGGGLGFVSHPPNVNVSGYGIEFDTWQNIANPVTGEHQDPSAHHIALIEDWVGNHLTYENDTRTGDNVWHDVSVIVRYSHIQVFVDQGLVIDWNGAINRTYGMFGFCGATGSATDWHIIDNFTLEIHNPIEVPTDFPTIQEAISAASNEDTIFVRNGTYSGPIVIDKTLTLLGEDRNDTIIDGGANEPSGSIVLILADSVKISGFTFQHCRTGGCAVRLDGFVNMTFSDNIITECNEGVRILHSFGNVISNNIVQDCYYNTGLGFDWSYDNTVDHNTIVDSQYGISGGDGCYNNTFSENVIIGNAVGFGTNANDSKFFHNDFIGNNVHVILNGIGQFDDGYSSGGNYWSDYNGTDVYSGVYQNETGSDGIGDTPYTIDANNIDNYPLMHPYGSVQNLNTSLVYLTIQSAVNAPETLDGHTILVRSGTYFENVIVNKSVSLLGEPADHSSTIDGDGMGTVVTVVADNVSISRFSIQHSGHDPNNNGILLNGTSGCHLTNNVITQNGDQGILLFSSYHNVIDDNFIAMNSFNGIGSIGSSFNIIYNNNVTGNNQYGITLRDSSNDNVVTCNNITSNLSDGFELEYSDINNTVAENNIIGNNGNGIELFSSSSNNSVYGNIVTENSIGLFIDSSNNFVYHNSFINNIRSILSSDQLSLWDNGYPSGGNYWSDYNGTDLFSGIKQNETGSDGIGDTPYVIDANNLEHYPLANPWTPPDIAVMNLTTAKTIIGQGFTGSVKVTFENQGNKIEAFNFTVYANSTMIDSEQMLLAVTNNTTSFNWNTTGFAYGNYTITAHAEPLPEETDISNNNFTYAIVVHVGVPGDISGPNVGSYDGVCAMRDIAYLVLHFNTRPGDLGWNPNADVNNDGICNMRDIAIAVLHFEQHE